MSQAKQAVAAATTSSSSSSKESATMPVPEHLRRDFNWTNVIILLHLVILSMLGIYLLFTATYIRTILFMFVMIFMGLLGVTAGAHRLWAHHSYNACTNLKIFLMICQTLVGQGSIYNWVLNHRIHHKYYGTNFDPYNLNRGFLYSHFMHFIQSKHEYHDRIVAEIDMSDMEADKVVMFQKRWYWLLYGVVFLLLPMDAPASYWGESLLSSIIVLGWLRYFLVLNAAWLVHSATHIWSIKPNEKYPCETNMVFFVNKNFWIDYHYLAPWDYLASEFGKYGTDCTSKLIRAWAAVGWASELKTIDSDTIKEVTYESVVTNRPLKDCLAEVEKVCLDKEYYLKPLNVIM